MRAAIERWGDDLSAAERDELVRLRREVFELRGNLARVEASYAHTVEADREALEELRREIASLRSHST